jgi:hypothetical protein
VEGYKSTRPSFSMHTAIPKFTGGYYLCPQNQTLTFQRHE